VRLRDVPADMVEAARQSLEGFEALHGAIAPDIYALSFSLILDHDDAEEVFQEVMLRIYRHLGTLRDCGAFGPWATRMVVHAVRTVQARKQQLRVVGALGRGWSAEDQEVAEWPEPVDGGAGPAELASSRELSLAVSRALMALPPRQRESILLFEMRGLSLAEVAEAMDCSAGAVKFHLHEGRQKLRAALGGWMEGSPRS
jgi:RNA polymerase sigma-70 factor (ECF subfamily)